MATTFQRIISAVNVSQLKSELNNSTDLTVTCTDVRVDGDNITLTFFTDMPAEEEPIMDAIIADHVVASDMIDSNQLPFSDLGNKLWVHSSSKPVRTGKDYKVVWTGVGDDINTHTIGAGELLHFSVETGVTSVSKIVEFDPIFGEVFIHEGYAKWDGAGPGDYIYADIVARASPLQTAANLDLTITDNWVQLAAGGPGTGTHGFAGTPVLIPRNFSKDGDWDYDETNGLQPNLGQTGNYKISDIERDVHRYINKIPTFGNSYGYTRLTSEETAALPDGYYIRICAYNASNTNWTASVIIEIFRERTCVP